MDGRNNDDGMRYAMINDARRTVQKLSEVLDGGFDAHGLGEDEKDAWLLQVECLREAVEDATANVAGELPSPVPSLVVREASADSSEMFEGLALAPSGTSTDTSDLDLFSGLNIVATPRRLQKLKSKFHSRFHRTYYSKRTIASIAVARRNKYKCVSGMAGTKWNTRQSQQPRCLISQNLVTRQSLHLLKFHVRRR